MSRIQIKVHESKRIVCVWLTKNESGDPGVQALMKPLYKQYRSLKYTVAVFRSGTQELSELTGELLKYNRRLLAEREVQAAKKNT